MPDIAEILLKYIYFDYKSAGLGTTRLLSQCLAIRNNERDCHDYVTCNI